MQKAALLGGSQWELGGGAQNWGAEPRDGQPPASPGLRGRRELERKTTSSGRGARAPREHSDPVVRERRGGRGQGTQLQSQASWGAPNPPPLPRPAPLRGAWRGERHSSLPFLPLG